MSQTTEEMVERRRPCPWCGELPEYVRAERDFATLDEALLADPDVRCRTPKCVVRFFPTAMTLDEWNNRAALASIPPQAEIERLREALEAVSAAMLGGGDGASGDYGWDITALNKARPLIRAALTPVSVRDRDGEPCADENCSLSGEHRFCMPATQGSEARDGE